LNRVAGFPSASRHFLFAIVTFGLLTGVGVAGPQIGKVKSRPLGPSPAVKFPSVKLSVKDEWRFLLGDFVIVKTVKALPPPIVKVYTEQGGPGLLMADPGGEFNSTDFMSDRSVPRMRLKFAGVLQDRCFVLYEQGGIALFYKLAFFKIVKLRPEDGLVPISEVYCGPASNLDQLRGLVASGGCLTPAPQ
jgi:hypothetical protein